jgi:hypothetical protein
MLKLELIETVSGKAVRAGNIIILLSELSELKEPGYVGSIAYDSQYGIFYKLKNSAYRNTLCQKDFPRTTPEDEIDNYRAELQIVYDFILKNWIQ